MHSKSRAKNCIKVMIAFSIMILTNAAFSEPLKEFQMFSGSIKVTDISGQPVKDAAVYGYCEDLHLIWPRTPDNQYTIAWKQNYFAKTNSEGIVRAEVPRGKWNFIAVGLTEGDQVLCVGNSIEVHDGFSIALIPSTVLQSTYRLGRSNHPGSVCLLSKLFIMQSTVPLYVQLPIETRKEVIFQVTEDYNFYLWGKGYTEDDKTVFVVNFGKIQNGRRDPLSLNQIILRGKMNTSIDLKWIRRWHEGLQETTKIKPGQRFAVSNGECSIGYKRKIGNLWCDFVSKYFNFSGAEKGGLTISNNLRVNLWTQDREEQPLVQLFLIDDNGFHVKRLFKEDGQVFRFDVTMKQGGRVLKGKTHPRDMTFGFDDSRFTGKEIWNFSIPLNGLKDKWYSKTSFVQPSGRFFTMKVPPDLTNYAVNYLKQLDAYSIKMKRICGRKKQIARTLLNLSIEGGTSATMSGKYYHTANHVLFRDFPIQRHSFPHEMAHNFRLLHGGLQETVVEVSRSASDFIIYGQESKWLFIDRMNDRRRNERWYPYTAIYLWGYSQGGPRFLRQLSKFEPILLKEGAKNGFSKEEIIAAMFSAFLERNLFEVSKKYGFCDDESRYAEALKLVKRYLLPYRT